MVGDSAKNTENWLRSGETVNCPPQFWDGVLRRLGTDMPAFTLDAWLRPLAVEHTGQGLRLSAPTPFHRDRIRARFLSRIAQCVADETGQQLPIELGVANGWRPRVLNPPRMNACSSGSPTYPSPTIPTFAVLFCKACSIDSAPLGDSMSIVLGLGLVTRGTVNRVQKGVRNRLLRNKRLSR